MPNEQTAFPMFHLHFGLGPQDECESASLYLPANDHQIKKALDSIDSCCLDECVLHSLAGRISQVAVSYRDMDQFDQLNTLAFQAVELEKQGLFPTYLALVESARCSDIESALQLVEHTEEYLLEPEVRSYEAVVREELSAILSGEDMQFLLPSLDTTDYGLRLMERDNLRFTGQGLLSRRDRQPISAWKPPEQAQEQEQEQEQDTTEYQQTM